MNCVRMQPVEIFTWHPKSVMHAWACMKRALYLMSCCLFVGSANMDPRSLRLNTEVGLLVDSPPLNARLRELLATDLLPANAWKVELDDQGELLWIGPDGAQRHTPPASFYLRAESWFFGLLPIEDQM